MICGSVQLAELEQLDQPRYRPRPRAGVEAPPTQDGTLPQTELVALGVRAGGVPRAAKPDQERQFETER